MNHTALRRWKDIRFRKVGKCSSCYANTGKTKRRSALISIVMGSSAKTVLKPRLYRPSPSQMAAGDTTIGNGPSRGAKSAPIRSACSRASSPCRAPRCQARMAWYSSSRSLSVELSRQHTFKETGGPAQVHDNQCHAHAGKAEVTTSGCD